MVAIQNADYEYLQMVYGTRRKITWPSISVKHCIPWQMERRNSTLGFDSFRDISDIEETVFAWIDGWFDGGIGELLEFIADILFAIVWGALVSVVSGRFNEGWSLITMHIWTYCGISRAVENGESLGGGVQFTFIPVTNLTANDEGYRMIMPISPENMLYRFAQSLNIILWLHTGPFWLSLLQLSTLN